MEILPNLISVALFTLLSYASADACGNIPVVANAEPNDTNISPPFAYGVGIKYQCLPDFKAKGGSDTAVCKGDTWDVPTLRCDPVGCGNLPAVEHAVPVLENRQEFYDVGTNVRYRCDVGYINQQGTNVAVCSLRNGRSQWNVPSLTCGAVNCGPPPDARFASKIGNLFTFPNEVAYVCNEGYKMMSDRPNTTCLPNGHWSVGPPTCQIVSCPVPVSPRNGRAEFVEVTYSSDVKYVCNEGYKVKGDKEANCRSNGTWSHEAPECELVKCPPYFTLPGGRVVLGVNETDAGSLVIFECNPPDRTRLTIKCNDNGEWNRPPPFCPVDETTTTFFPTKPTTTKSSRGKEGIGTRFSNAVKSGFSYVWNKAKSGFRSFF